MDHAGQQEFLGVQEADYLEPRVSPDGTRVAFSIPDEATTDSIWVTDATRGTLSRITLEGTDDSTPIWTPDGGQVVYTADRDGDLGFYRKSADGTGEAELLVTIESASQLRAGNWTPDGSQLVFTITASGTSDIGVLSMEGEPSWEPLFGTDIDEYGPVLSPDGQWVAYVSTDTGQPEVYVQRFPDLGERQQISTDGGIDPLWSPDGRALYYLGTGGGAPDDMRVVSIDPGPPFSVGRPDVLFSTVELLFRRPRGEGRYHDIAPDGQQFLILSRQGASEAGAVASQIDVVLNWFEEVTERVPVP